MMKKTLLFALLISTVLGACSNSITAKEAEEIAIQTAINEGYVNPQLFTEYDTVTKEKYHYSPKKDKDIKVWRVSLVTDERPREVGLFEDLIYLIDVENGEIVDKISGVD